MTRFALLDLREAIPREEFDYIALLDALARYKAPRQKIHELLKAGVITRVKKGLYVFSRRMSRAPICLETLANQIYGPSCVSLEYALSFHGLIPERVVEVTSVTPKRNKLFETPLGRFQYRYLAASRYPHGIDRIFLDAGHPVLMATPEKALCDYIVLSPSVRFSSPAGARDFLEHDLRIEPDRWPDLKSNVLDQLIEAYRDPRLEALKACL